MYSCQTEIFELELTICIKMDLALNNLQRLIYLKSNQPTNNQKPFTSASHDAANYFSYDLAMFEGLLYRIYIFWLALSRHKVRTMELNAISVMPLSYSVEISTWRGLHAKNLNIISNFWVHNSGTICGRSETIYWNASIVFSFLFLI